MPFRAINFGGPLIACIFAPNYLQSRAMALGNVHWGDLEIDRQRLGKMGEK